MLATAKKPAPKPDREAVYLDAADDVAAVIETIKETRSKIVALVLPKRNDVFKSIVNLKLIKRVGEQIPKTIILITTDQTTIGLAAGLKILVSPNLQTEPAIPAPTSRAEVDTPPPMAPIEIEAPPGAKPRRPRRPDKPSRRPQRSARGYGRPGHWQKFGRWWLGGLLLLALLLIGWWALDEPQATVTIRTRAESVSAQLEAQLRADFEQPDWDSDPVRLPLGVHRSQATLTATITATGQRSIGNYASGDVTVINCQSSALRIPNQTVVKRSGLSFVTLETINLGPSNADCDVFPGTSGTVRVRATQFGANYNLQPGSYEVDGLDDESYRANGGRMTGGSQRLVTVVNQSDIDQAVEAVDDQRDDDSAAGKLRQQLVDDGLQPLEATFEATAQKPQSTVEIGDEISSGQIRLVINYQIAAINRDHIDRLAQAELAPQAGNLVVVDNGLESANYRLTKPSGGSGQPDYRLRVEIFEAKIGLGLDQLMLFERIKGQPRKVALADLRRLPGVIGVEIDINPFWRSAIPTKPDRVEIIIEDNSGEVISD